MKFNNKRGFTLIEVIVVAGIIAILAGILVPMIFNQIDESRKTRALADCKSIQTAIMTFRKDTGAWPNKSTPTASDISMLSGLGTQAPDADLAALGFDMTTRQRYADHLKSDENSAYGSLWKGPYLTIVESDPWGNAYITNVKDLNFVSDPLNPSSPPTVWILSAGPKGTLETSTNSSRLGGDDIGVVLK